MSHLSKKNSSKIYFVPNRLYFKVIFFCFVNKKYSLFEGKNFSNVTFPFKLNRKKMQISSHQ